MKHSLSVITICFNNLADLIATCASVDVQTMKPTEHLVIDGSTNTEILDWLTTTNQPAYRRWIHERDNGISDAFNKGIIHSEGAVTHLLNSGDRYYVDTAIATSLSAFSADPALEWTHGRYVQHRGNMDVITGGPFNPKTLWKGMHTVAHPTMFISRNCYDKHGLYSLDLRVAMDYDLLIRIRNEKFQFIAEPLIYFAPGGASHVQFQRGLAEVKNSHRKHIGKSARQWLWQSRQRLLHVLMAGKVGAALFRLKNRRRKAKHQS